MVPALFHNMRRALLPLMDNDIYKHLASVVQRIEGNSADSRLASDAAKESLEMDE